MFKVCLIEHTQVIFEGMANSVVLPGDQGEFEIRDFHFPIVSLLKEGYIIVDEVGFPVAKGIAKFVKDELIALMEV